MRLMASGRLIPLSETDTASARVVMLPHAGGTPQTYASWTALFPDEIELVGVALPEDGSVTQRQGFTLQDLAAEIARELRGLPPLPTALYGHSMGAMLAYAIAVEMKANGDAAPVHITVSASRPPHVPLKRRKMHTLCDADFLHELRKLGGTPEQVMRESDLMAARLPVMRAQFRALETYEPFRQPKPEHMLDIDVHAYGGTDDHLDEADIAAWRALARGEFAHAMLDGGHFFNRRHAAHLAKGLRIAVFKAVARGQRATTTRNGTREENAHV